MQLIGLGGYGVSLRLRARQALLLACCLLPVMLLASLPLAAEQGHEDAPQPAGQLDLRQWDFAADGPVPLTVDWRFYPNTLLQAERAELLPEQVRVPEIWNGHVQRDGRAGYGTGTYGLTVLLPPGAEKLGLSIRTLSSAFSVFANGTLVAKAGVVGPNAAASKPAYRPQVALLPDIGGRLDLLVQVSNFHHARGGLWDVVKLGDYEALREQFQQDLQLSMFLASVALLLGVYHLMIWSQRRRDTSVLVFAALCVSLALRTLCTEEIYLLQLIPSLPYNAQVRIEYLSIILLVALGTVFVANVFPQEFGRRALYILTVPHVLYFLVVCLGPVAFFSRYLPLFHALVITCVLYSLYVTIKATLHRCDGAIPYALSIAAVALFILHSVLVTIFPEFLGLDAIRGSEYLLPVGFVGVLFTQAMVLAQRSTSAMESLELRTQELSAARDRLDEYAQELERRVAERTAELESANAQLDQLARIDSLTELPNRRHFDEKLSDAWADHARGKRPLSLVLVDVDHFKQYNDHYGHVQGDQVLKQVAAALREAVKRPTDFVARYGGEELVALLPNTERAGALQIAERMRGQVEALGIPHAAGEHGVLTVSVGLGSAVPETGEAAYQLLRQADKALYRAKSGGRNQVQAVT